MSVTRLGVSNLGPDRLQGRLTLAEAMLADSPLGLWLMQEPSGATMTDSSGNGRNGTYTGVTLAQTPLDPSSAYSASFAGTSTSIADVAYGAWMNVSAWTVTALLKPTNFSDIRYAFSRYAGSQEAWNFRFTNITGAMTLRALTTGGSKLLTGSNATAGATIHLAIVLGATNIQIYRDGVLDAEVAHLGGTAVTTTSALRIGDINNGIGNDPFLGTMSHVGYFGTALTAERILAHAQAAGLA